MSSGGFGGAQAATPDQLRHRSALAHFGQQAPGSDDPDEIPTEACRLVGEALGTDFAGVMEIQPDGETLPARTAACCWWTTSGSPVRQRPSGCAG